MARRKVTRDKDEIEYRLLELVRHARAWGPEEIKARLFAILMLAKMWGVDLSNALIDSALENLKVPRVTLRGSYSTKEKKSEEAIKLLPTVFSKLDKAAKKGIIHKNLAGRKKSRLSLKVLPKA